MCLFLYQIIFRRGHNSGSSAWRFLSPFAFFHKLYGIGFLFSYPWERKNSSIPIICQHQRYRDVLWLYSLSIWVQVEYPLEVGQESRLFQELRAQFPMSSVWCIFLWCGSFVQYRRTLSDQCPYHSLILTCTRFSLLLSSRCKALLVMANPHRNILPKLMLVQHLWVYMSKWIWKD